MQDTTLYELIQNVIKRKKIFIIIVSVIMVLTLVYSLFWGDTKNSASGDLYLGGMKYITNQGDADRQNNIKVSNFLGSTNNNTVIRYLEQSIALDTTTYVSNPYKDVESIYNEGLMFKYIQSKDFLQYIKDKKIIDNNIKMNIVVIGTTVNLEISTNKLKTDISTIYENVIKEIPIYTEKVVKDEIKEIEKYANEGMKRESTYLNELEKEIKLYISKNPTEIKDVKEYRDLNVFLNDYATSIIRHSQYQNIAKESDALFNTNLKVDVTQSNIKKSETGFIGGVIGYLLIGLLASIIIAFVVANFIEYIQTIKTRLKEEIK